MKLALAGSGWQLIKFCNKLSVVITTNTALLSCTASELVQCRRAAKGCLPPLPAQTRPRYSENPTNMANIFGPLNRHPAPPCHKGNYRESFTPLQNFQVNVHTVKTYQSRVIMRANTRTNISQLVNHSCPEAQIPVEKALVLLKMVAMKSSSSMNGARFVQRPRF